MRKGAVIVVSGGITDKKRTYRTLPQESCGITIDKGYLSIMNQFKERTANANSGFAIEFL